MPDTFRLKRTKQCEKCPWKKSTDPHTIPNGYSVRAHEALRGTIAVPGALTFNPRIMACHEHPVGREVHCLGWLIHQLGPGNNLGLRMQMRRCENVGEVELDGEQHDSFEDTLPPPKPRRKRTS